MEDEERMMINSAQSVSFRLSETGTNEIKENKEITPMCGQAGYFTAKDVKFKSINEKKICHNLCIFVK